jgi:hypothetical protein
MKHWRRVLQRYKRTHCYVSLIRDSQIWLAWDISFQRVVASVGSVCFGSVFVVNLDNSNEECHFCCFGSAGNSHRRQVLLEQMRRCIFLWKLSNNDVTVKCGGDADCKNIAHPAPPGPPVPSPTPYPPYHTRQLHQPHQVLVAWNFWVA